VGGGGEEGGGGSRCTKFQILTRTNDKERAHARERERHGDKGERKREGGGRGKRDKERERKTKTESQRPGEIINVDPIAHFPTLMHLRSRDHYVLHWRLACVLQRGAVCCSML